MINYLIQDPIKDAPPWAETPATSIDEWGQLPVQAGNFDHVDGLFYFTYAVCIVFFVIITAVLLYSVVAHRRKTWDQKPLSNVTHNTPLEVVWTVVPLIIVMIMFAWGFKGSLDMTTVPHEAQLNTYKASAKQWAWQFTYPNGTQGVGEVYVEIGKPVQFILESSDVLHAFYAPSMRVKRDIVPGRYSSVWFTPTKMGVFHLFCAEYCGDNHSRMYARLRVVDSTTMDDEPWNQVPTAEDPIEDRVAYGATLARQLCSSCHKMKATDVVNTGPSWLGMYSKEGDEYIGRQREVIEAGVTKTITTDDAYIIESIRNPTAKIVAEEPYRKGAMSKFESLDDGRIACLIAYMKSLADN
ncbi:MAG: cytochrome c oxidase subunit 2 [Planctomycetota bacterium]